MDSRAFASRSSAERALINAALPRSILVADDRTELDFDKISSNEIILEVHAYFKLNTFHYCSFDDVCE